MTWHTMRLRTSAAWMALAATSSVLALLAGIQLAGTQLQTAPLNADVRVAEPQLATIQPGLATSAPNVVGASLGVARQRLLEANFTVQSSEVMDCDHFGTVVSQTPKAGTLAAPGSTIQVRIGRPPSPPRHCF